jgi:hypothetical protein
MYSLFSMRLLDRQWAPWFKNYVRATGVVIVSDSMCAFASVLARDNNTRTSF